jgi:hypothetical protein
MKSAVIVLGGVLCIFGGAPMAQAQEALAPSGPALQPPVNSSADPSGARRFLDDPGELVTLYGSRRFDPYYEPGRLPPPTDPSTGWPLDWSLGPYSLVGGYYSPYAYRYSPYGYGYYHSLYRPRYVPYGYGYGWGYRYPFGYYPWRAYGSYPPWHLDVGYGWQSPYVGHGASFHNEGVLVSPPAEFGGCFFW